MQWDPSRTKVRRNSVRPKQVLPQAPAGGPRVAGPACLVQRFNEQRVHASLRGPGMLVTCRPSPEAGRERGALLVQSLDVEPKVVLNERRDEVVPVVVALMSAQRQRLIDDSASSFELIWKELSCQELV